MYFCKVLRDNGIFMFVNNMEDFGHLARLDTFDTSVKNAEFYEMYSNEVDWKRRYIHENYSQALEDGSIIEQPCPDVFWFPVVSPRFCNDLIGEFV